MLSSSENLSKFRARFFNVFLVISSIDVFHAFHFQRASRKFLYRLSFVISQTFCRCPFRDGESYAEKEPGNTEIGSHLQKKERKEHRAVPTTRRTGSGQQKRPRAALGTGSDSYPVRQFVVAQPREMRRFYAVILPLLAIMGSRGQDKMKMIYSWKTLEFDFPSEQIKLTAINSGIFIPGAPLPIDVDVYNTELKTTVFVSIPRFQNGVPFTLGYVTDRVSADGNPLIAPYPSWIYNNIGNCDSITSVYRMQVDQCGRLWVLDTGKLGEKRLCPPKLHIFSLLDNTLITMHKLPPSQIKEDSLHVTIAVDVRETENKCKDTFAYIADVTGFALIVYDFRNSRSWMITNNLFYPYPQYGTFNIKGDTFDLMDGIIGLALGPVLNDDRILYFHSLASRVEAWVPTSVIRNYTIFADNPDAAARSFVPFAQERTSQSAAQAMDNNGVLFFGLLSDLAIACWNSKHFLEYGGKNNEVIIKDTETLQFPSGIKIVTSQSGKQELWVLTASFQRYASGTLQTNETNFRIQAGFVDELVRGTKCDVAALNGRAPISQ